MGCLTTSTRENTSFRFNFSESAEGHRNCKCSSSTPRNKQLPINEKGCLNKLSRKLHMVYLSVLFLCKSISRLILLR